MRTTTAASATRLGAASLLAVWSLTVAGSALPAPQKGGTLVFALGGDLTTVNPALTSTISEAMIGCAIYQGLIETSSAFEPKPLLAKSWTISADGLTYGFDLQTASWQDGRPFTSADVAYSLVEFNTKASPMFRPAGQLIDRIETPASDKVIIHLKQPSGTFLMSLSCIQGGSIVPEHVFKGTDPRTNPASSTVPVGTGPFKLAAWVRGDSITLERNATYWDQPRPYLDKIIGKIIPQSTSRLQALQAGEIDFIQGWNLAPSDEVVVRRNPELRLQTTGYAPATVFVEFNIKRALLSDVRVRRALFMATNRNFLIQTTWFGDGKVPKAPFNGDIRWALNEAVDLSSVYRFDPEAASRLLDEVGYGRQADGIRFALKISVSSEAPERSAAAQALKSMWRTIGVDLQVEALERTVFANQVYVAREFDVTMEGLNTFGDPAFGITRVYATDAIGRVAGNASQYSNPDVDALFARAALAVDRGERGALYKEAQTILAKDVPVMPIRDYRMTDAVSRDVEGLWGALGPADWANASLERK